MALQTVSLLRYDEYQDDATVLTEVIGLYTSIQKAKLACEKLLRRLEKQHGKEAKLGAWRTEKGNHIVKRGVVPILEGLSMARFTIQQVYVE